MSFQKTVTEFHSLFFVYCYTMKNKLITLLIFFWRMDKSYLRKMKTLKNPIKAERTIKATKRISLRGDFFE